uniref:Centrosomal protein 95 n=1 Tax=Crocodylus porosus TaxID=8502 RepID=A0A7M4DWT8_CROPO
MKCHINLHIKKLLECDANVFVHLYESILGEKVPDYITAPRTQEDDAHNVQAIIDSLALDYLQVSLSHITGENIVKGERESIRNLLEIFDGLLEYLTEVSEASSQSGGEWRENSRTSQFVQANLLCYVLLRSSQSEISIPFWEVEGSESTSELIKLGDTATSLHICLQGSAESVHSTEFHKESLSSSAKKLGEPIRPAIPLQPPYQPSEPRPHYPIGREYQSPGRQSAALANSQTIKTPAVSDNLLLDFIITLYYVMLALGTKVMCVCFCSGRYESSIPDSLGEEPLSRRRAKGKLSGQELEEVSEKLARRLNELDLMLKRALGERSREEELTDEDRLSQHSDSVMDYQRRILHPGTPCPKKNTRPRSLSPSPPPSRYLHPSAFEDVLQRDARGQMGQMRRQLQKEQDYRRMKAKVTVPVSQLLAYEDELRIYEARERLEFSKLRAKAKEKVSEALRKRLDGILKYLKVTSAAIIVTWHMSSLPTSLTFSLAVKVKDDDLLPLLLEEFPHLHISHHSLNKMWQQQLAQIERFKSSSGTERSRLKLQNEVEEALKKRDLLAEIIKKDQDHNKRLQEFKQRIHRQKWMQNKTREKRQQIARAKKYYEDYRVQLRARMMRARTREEKIFKNLFEEGLEIQKQRLEELRAYAKEKRAEQKRVQQNELESMENYYKDQFSMLAEAVSQEHQEIKTRERTQAKMLQKTKREVRSKVEKEIQQLQTMITQDDDDTFFRELEAERLKSRLQMASFQYSKNHFL